MRLIIRTASKFDFISVRACRACSDNSWRSDVHLQHNILTRIFLQAHNLGFAFLQPLSRRDVPKNPFDPAGNGFAV
jgi:hypothetical protein